MTLILSKRAFPLNRNSVHFILSYLHLTLYTLHSEVCRPSYLAKVILTNMDLIPEVGLVYKLFTPSLLKALMCVIKIVSRDSTLNFQSWLET